MYSSTPYFLAKVIIDLPLSIISPLIFSSMVYFVIGLSNTMYQFGIFYLTVLLIVQAGSSLGYLVSTLFNNEMTALIFSPLVLLLIILFGGLFSNVDTLPIYVKWI